MGGIWLIDGTSACFLSRLFLPVFSPRHLDSFIFHCAYRIYTASLTTLTTFSRLLHQSPADSNAYSLRLYPLALERAAMLDALELEEQHALDSVRAAWKAETSQIEDEYRKGKLRLKERVLEGLEERRRRAREEKEGDGVVPNGELFVSACILQSTCLYAPASDSPLEALSNSRNANGPSRYTPPFVLTAPAPYGLAPDDLASPFPLSLTSIQPVGGAAANRKPRQNRNGGREGGVLTLGKAIAGITASKDGEVDHDLGEIRRAVKRRKAAVKAAGGNV